MCDFGVFLTASVVGLTMLKVTIIHMPKTDTGDHDSVLSCAAFIKLIIIILAL